MGMGELESRMREKEVERERNCSEREIGEEAEWKTIQGIHLSLTFSLLSL